MKPHRRARAPIQKQRGGRVLGSYVTVPAARGRQVKPRSIVCPDCNAGLDEPCVTAAGTPAAGQGHVSRHRMATRARNAAVEAEAAAPAPVVPPRPGAGPLAACPVCGVRVRLVQGGSGLGGRRGEFVVPNHQPGGGRYSSRRGDALCAGALEIADPDSL